MIIYLKKDLKNSYLVNFPIKNLKMNQFANDTSDRNYTYDLYSAIYYEPPINSNNEIKYYSICYNNLHEKWF